MSKDQTHEQALEQVTATKEALKEARVTLREFKAENKIKRDKVPEDEKIAKKLITLNEAVDTARELVDEAKAAEKELRPRKIRETKYDYPEGMDDKEKKRFRAKIRREKKAAEKAEAGDGDGDAKPKAKKTIKKKSAEPKEDPED